MSENKSIFSAESYDYLTRFGIAGTLALYVINNRRFRQSEAVASTIARHVVGAAGLWLALLFMMDTQSKVSLLYALVLTNYLPAWMLRTKLEYLQLKGVAAADIYAAPWRTRLSSMIARAGAAALTVAWAWILVQKVAELAAR